MKPEAGDIGFGIIPGGVGGFVALGQLMLGDACRYTHAFVVVEDDQVVEAMPAGAHLVPIGRRAGSEYAYVRLPLTEDQRQAFLRAARGYVGVGYGFSTYLALALAQWGIPHRLLRSSISRRGRMICSQLVDQALTDAGVHLFADGRLPQDVTPGDLYYALADIEGAREFKW